MAKKAQPAQATKLTDWVTQERKRKILSFVGGGLVVVCGAAWALFQYLDKPDVKAEVAYKLCVGREEKWCPAGSIYIPGIVNTRSPSSAQSIVAKWVNEECAKYSKKNTIFHSGPVAECSCAIVEVKCSTE